MSDNVLKKEFKQSDVQRVRNIVNKDFTAKTKSQTGYQRSYTRHEEGDVWEESGKTWTIKNGVRQNITKLDSAKKAVRMPLACPKCGEAMKHRFDKKTYKIHGFCFDCTIDYEAQLRKAGLYEKYEASMINGSIDAFAKDLTAWVNEYVNYKPTYVTEQGDVEDWNSNSSIQNEKVLTSLKEFIDSEVIKIKKTLKSLLPKVNDKITKIKLSEAIDYTDTATKGKVVKDKHVVALMRYYELIKEIKNVQTRQNS